VTNVGTSQTDGATRLRSAVSLRLLQRDGERPVCASSNGGSLARLSRSRADTRAVLRCARVLTKQYGRRPPCNLVDLGPTY